MYKNQFPNAAWAIFAAAVIFSFASANAQGVEEIVVDGTVVPLEVTSVKCELGNIPGVSKRRLVNCDSAKLVTVSQDDMEKRAIRFTIDPFDDEISSGVRAELRDVYEASNGEEVWYRFSTLVPRDFPIDTPHRLVLAQWHERMHEGKPSLRPPLSHRLWNGRFVITLWNHERIEERGTKGDGEIIFETPQLERGVFHEFVYKVVWADDETGEIRAWKRECGVLEPECDQKSWRQIIHYRGSTGYSEDLVVGYYFKLGLYTVSEFETAMTAYHKGYRSGPTASSVGATAAAFR